MTHSRLLASLLVLPSWLAAQDRGPLAEDPIGGAPWTEAFGLTRVDGALHAAGPTYAARITAAGIEFMPAFGPRAERPFAVALAFASVHRGDQLVYARDGVAAEPREQGLRIGIRHGSDIEERFDIQRDGVEHSFVFARPLAGTGDLVVRLRVDTELTPCRAGEAIRYEKAGLGGVTVGAVTGIDAGGRACPGTLHYAAGWLEYRLPGSFVDDARYPLVLDPALGTAFTVLPTGSDAIGDVDVAFDATNAVYLVVWARGVSAGSTQIQAQRVSAAGVLTGGLITIQPAGGSEIVANPAVASVNAADKFIVVYERTPPAADIEIRARTVAASSGAVSSTSTLVSTLGIAARNPDIGGRSAATGSTALVVFETVAASSIQARVVSLSLSSLTPPSLVGSEVTVATQPGFDEYRPAVSRHEGAAGNYLVVWEREVVGRTFIGGRVVGNSGGAVLRSPMTAITPGTEPNEGFPDCATADGTGFLVVYENSGLPGIACKPASFAAATGTLAVGTELEIARAAPPPDGIAVLSRPAVDFAETRYLVVFEEFVHTSLLGTTTTVTRIRLSEVAPAECIFVAGGGAVASGTVTSTISGSSGSGVSGPAVGAVFSGDPALASDEGLVPWVRRTVTSTGIPPQPVSSRGVTACRVEAIGQGGPVANLAPGCGAAGTAGVNGPVAVGNQRFAFTLTGMPAGTSVAMFNLNVPVQLFGCGPCQILPFLIVIPVAASGGAASLPLPIACEPSLINARLAVQWTVLENPSSPCFLAPQAGFSNALSVTIGRN